MEEKEGLERDIHNLQMRMMDVESVIRELTHPPRFKDGDRVFYHGDNVASTDEYVVASSKFIGMVETWEYTLVNTKTFDVKHEVDECDLTPIPEAG